MVNAFIRELVARGVSVAHLKEVIASVEHMDVVARAVVSEEAIREEQLLRLAVLADPLPRERVMSFLKVVFPRLPHIARMCSERAAFEWLLSSVPRLQLWHRAAIVMYYGLGPNGKRYTHEQIAAATKRARSTVDLFLAQRYHHNDGGSAMWRIANAWRYAERGHDFAPLSLSDDLRRTLGGMEVRNLKELRCCTSSELRRGLSDDALFVELKTQLGRRGVTLWQ